VLFCRCGFFLAVLLAENTVSGKLFGFSAPEKGGHLFLCYGKGSEECRQKAEKNEPGKDGIGSTEGGKNCNGYAPE